MYGKKKLTLNRIETRLLDHETTFFNFEPQMKRKTKADDFIQQVSVINFRCYTFRGCVICLSIKFNQYADTVIVHAYLLQYFNYLSLKKMFFSGRGVFYLEIRS